jgi:hypothetical protein
MDLTSASALRWERSFFCECDKVTVRHAERNAFEIQLDKGLYDIWLAGPSASGTDVVNRALQYP